MYSNLKSYLLDIKNTKIDWKFNDSDGSIGLYAIDNTKSASITFIDGKLISKEKIKNTSRSVTRISGLPENIDLNMFIDNCNQILDEYRENTKDVFLTSFKGLRKDNMYRRRLDFKTAKKILNLAYHKSL